MFSSSETRICSQPLTNEELKIQNSNISQKEKNKFRAVSMKGKIWPQKQLLYIQYLDHYDVPLNFDITPENQFAKKLYDTQGNFTGKFAGPNNEPLNLPYKDKNGNIIDQNNNPILFDPIEKKCRDILNKAKSTNDQKKFSRAVKDCIKDIVMSRIQPYVNLTFAFEETPPKNNVPQIRISFRNKGCYSLLGTDCNNIIYEYTPKGKFLIPTMNFSWFDAPTVMHEFGHALGLCHEHQAPNIFKNKILWNLPVLYNWGLSIGWDREMVDNQIINRLKEDQVNNINFFKKGTVDPRLTEYDPDSIMLYFYPGSLTLNPATGKSPGQGTKQNRRLSKKDVLYLNALYPGDGESTWYKFWTAKRITPEQFYFKTYGEHITEPPKPLISPKQYIKQRNIITDNPVGFSLLFVFIILLVIAIIYIFIRK